APRRPPPNILAHPPSRRFVSRSPRAEPSGTPSAPGQYSAWSTSRMDQCVAPLSLERASPHVTPRPPRDHNPSPLDPHRSRCGGASVAPGERSPGTPGPFRCPLAVALPRTLLLFDAHASQRRDGEDPDVLRRGCQEPAQHSPPERGEGVRRDL